MTIYTPGKLTLAKTTVSPVTAYVQGLGIVTDGLVLNLDAGTPLSYPGTGTTWTDLSGNGNNGTLVNGVGFDNGNGGALSFDAVNNNYTSISNSSSLQFGETFTCNSWIYPTLITLRRVIFSTRINNPSGSWQLEIGTANGGNGRIAVTGINTWIYESNSNIISQNNWYNITYVKQNNATVGGSLYLNGILITPIVTTAYTITNNNDVKTIGFGQSTTQYFNGNIAQVSIYNRALTAAEVLQNYNALKGRYGL
jgi:hypothetical protein